MNPTTKSFLETVTAAMNDAEEIGGPEGAEYVALMLAIAEAAIERARAAGATAAQIAEVAS